MIAINRKILSLCDERNWSTYELAIRADITHSTLNSALNRDTAPKLDTLQRICDAFGITLAQFFIDDEQIEVLSYDEKELIARYRKLPIEKRNALMKLLDN